MQQGDTNASFQFVVVLDYAFGEVISGKEGESKGWCIKSVVVTHSCNFADDICLALETIDQGQELLREECRQELLRRVQRGTGKVVLHNSAAKSKFFLYTVKPKCKKIIMKNGSVLNAIIDVKYLGTWINTTRQDIKLRTVTPLLEYYKKRSGITHSQEISNICFL